MFQISSQGFETSGTRIFNSIARKTQQSEGKLLMKSKMSFKLITSFEFVGFFQRSITQFMIIMSWHASHVGMKNRQIRNFHQIEITNQNVSTFISNGVPLLYYFGAYLTLWPCMWVMLVNCLEVCILFLIHLRRTMTMTFTKCYDFHLNAILVIKLNWIILVT